MSDLIYLDHNATTPTDPRVMEEMLPYFNREFGNPSSIYKLANRADRVKEESREKVASLLNSNPSEVVFTSCGTESDNFALKGVAFANRDRGNHIITSKIEHHAVLNTCKWLENQGFEVTYINVDEDGIVDIDELRDAIRDKTILISVMHANNEVGTIQPIGEIASFAREKGIYFHTDAVQTVGKLPMDVENLGMDLLSLSGHKVYGPKGVGALYIRKGTRIEPLLDGGHHEKKTKSRNRECSRYCGHGKGS